MNTSLLFIAKNLNFNLVLVYIVNFRLNLMDKLSRQLLNILQFDFPLVSKPFLVIARKLGVSETKVITTIKLLKKKKIIREISGLFDSRKLGFASLLVALKVKPRMLNKVALTINACPLVSHNYARKDEWNLWFTLTHHKNIPREKAVSKLASQPGIEDYMLLPPVKVFKQDILFDLVNKKLKQYRYSFKEQKKCNNANNYTIKYMDKVYLSALETDLPIISEPFDLISKKYKISREQLFIRAQDYMKRGLMRRFGASLNHWLIGYKVNAMVVWNIPPEEVSEAAEKMIKFPQVGHCCQRVKRPNWNYNLYCTLHCKNYNECERVINLIARRIKLNDYKILFSTKEYKKERIKFFSPKF